MYLVLNKVNFTESIGNQASELLAKVNGFSFGCLQFSYFVFQLPKNLNLVLGLVKNEDVKSILIMMSR